MKLVIGGYSQGKLDFVLREIDTENCLIYDGEVPDEMQQNKQVIINHFHSWVKSRLLQGKNPEEEIEVFLKNNDNCVIICDEIGNGIVPIEAFEREYRERTGRILVKLAGRANEVVRVVCGIGQKIK